MLCSRFTDPFVLQQGIFGGTRLNPFIGTVSTYGTPAIVADIDPTSGTTWWTSDILANTTKGNLYGNPVNWQSQPVGLDWPLLPTTTVYSGSPGDYLQWTTSAYAIDIAVSQSVYGGILHVEVDTQPYFATSCFTGVTNPPYRIYLDGQTHTIRLTLLGDYQWGTSVTGSVYTSAGTANISQYIGVANNGTPVHLPGVWTFHGAASSVSVYDPNNIYKGNVGINTTNTTIIPGVNVSLASGTWTTSDVADLILTGPFAQVQYITQYTALESTATYQSPVLGSGNPNTEWNFWEFDLGGLTTPAPTISAYIGVEGDWTPFGNLVPVIYPDPLGKDFQRVVYSVPSGNAGKKAYLIGVLDGHPDAWISNVRLYTRDTTTDTFLSRFPDPIRSGPNMAQTLLSLEAASAYLDELADEYLASTSISTASGQYLTMYGNQFNLPRNLGEGDNSYRSRLLTLFTGRQNGGSATFLQQVLTQALLVENSAEIYYTAPPTDPSQIIDYSTISNPPDQVIVSQLSKGGTQFALGMKGGVPGNTLGQTPLGSSVQGYWHWMCFIPLRYLAIPPETALNIVNYFRPTGSIVSIVFT